MTGEGCATGPVVQEEENPARVPEPERPGRGLGPVRLDRGQGTSAVDRRKRRRTDYLIYRTIN